MRKKAPPLKDKERFFKRFSRLIDQLFDIEQRCIATYQDRLRFSLLLDRRGFGGLGDVVGTQEGALFRLISQEGPIVLAHPEVQNKIIKWLESSYEASAKLTNLKDALLIYAMCLKKERAGKHIRGPRKAEITRAIGTEKLLDVYSQFLSRLKELKKFIRARENPNKALLEWGVGFINDNKNAMYEYATKFLGVRENEARAWIESDEPKSLGRPPTKAKIIKWQEEFDALARKIKESGYGIIFFQIIASDSFRKEIIDMGWSPNEMAKKIMARELGISESQLTKILFLKKSRADKNKELPA